MYYPKSQIQTNLYTNGGELMTRLGKREYIGYYYEVSDGKNMRVETQMTKSQLN